MMTNVKGYFNPNTYKVNVAISELGISVQLEPQEFIVERSTGKKINDPILDRYVGYKMLSPELSNGPVPVIKIPKFGQPQPSVHVVNAGQRDATGKWHLPAPGQNTQETHLKNVPANVTKPSTVGMSIEEARRRGFIGKVKLVDEDYGAAETDGAPTRGDAIPRIKYAMESQAPLARPGQLPQEIVESVRPDVAPVLAGLQKAAASDPEAVSLGRKAAEQAVAAQQGKQGVQAFRAEVKKAKAKKAPVPTAAMPPASAPPTAPATPTIIAAPGAPRRRVAQVVVPTPSPLPVVPESPLVGGRPDLPQPELEESVEEAPVVAQPPAEKPQPGEQKQPIRCAGCGKEFPYMSYYKRHVLRAHKDRLTELMPAEK